MLLSLNHSLILKQTNPYYFKINIEWILPVWIFRHFPFQLQNYQVPKPKPCSPGRNPKTAGLAYILKSIPNLVYNSKCRPNLQSGVPLGGKFESSHQTLRCTVPFCVCLNGLKIILLSEIDLIGENNTFRYFITRNTFHYISGPCKK